MKLNVIVREGEVTVADMMFEEATLLAFASTGLKQLLTEGRVLEIRRVS